MDHANSIGHSARPFQTVDEMNEALVKNWNGMVSVKDTVYIHGDFAWKNHTHWIAALNGKKVLIRGNHDKMPDVALKQFSEVHDVLWKVFYGRYMFWMSHYAHRVWRNSCHGSWHTYGHSHASMPEEPWRLACDVGVDAWDYQPVHVDIIIKKLLARAEKAAGEEHRYRTEEEFALARRTLQEENRKWRTGSNDPQVI
jgi:calcineurin-like phosphoesterase family protein